MKFIEGFWIPDYENHYCEINKKTKQTNIINYQHNVLFRAISYCKKFDVAIDGGANIGIISKTLTKIFNDVYAFEPGMDVFKCFLSNMKDTGVHGYRKALSNENKTYYIEQSPVYNTGSRELTGEKINKDYISAEGVKLDDFELKECDFIKLDVQGFELFALQGAKHTLKNFHPVCMVEIEDLKKLKNPFNVDPKNVINYLKKFGYKTVDIIGRDHIFA